jgi:hypothetical protein
MNPTTRLTLTFALATMLTACVGEPEPTTFAFVNDGDAEIYHDLQPGWLSLEVDGEPASLNRPSCMKKCGSLKGAFVCSLIDYYPTVIELKPGEETVVEWDGVYFEIDEDRDCYRERRRPAEFQAKFCYGYDYDDIDGDDVGGDGPEVSNNRIGGAQIGEPVCEVQAFERGGTVELLAE